MENAIAIDNDVKKIFIIKIWINAVFLSIAMWVLVLEGLGIAPPFIPLVLIGLAMLTGIYAGGVLNSIGQVLINGAGFFCSLALFNVTSEYGDGDPLPLVVFSIIIIGISIVFSAIGSKKVLGVEKGSARRIIFIANAALLVLNSAFGAVSTHLNNKPY